MKSRGWVPIYKHSPVFLTEKSNLGGTTRVGTQYHWRKGKCICLVAGRVGTRGGGRWGELGLEVGNLQAPMYPL